MSASNRARLCGWLFGGLLAVPAVAHAGGYDTPMLYTARHMGMGGTAIGYVSDPSALFHNPAGLGHIQHAEVIADFSLLLGGIHGSPEEGRGKDVDSELTVAPFFLVGAGYRIQRMITLGVGVYPIASAGATYHYGAAGYENRTELFFLEASPAVAVNPLPNLRLGIGYRVTYVRLVRFQGQVGSSDPKLDFKMAGQNFTGFRVGAEWDALPWLHFGAVFRNKVRTKIDGDQGVAFVPYTDISTHFTLPAKLGVGTRVDFDPLRIPASLAIDFEYDFNSQNPGDPLAGTPEPGHDAPSSVPNIFKWKDSQTLRIGAEYRILHDAETDLDRVPLRLGYVYDTQTANARYPTAFGTPPGPTQVITAGTGYNGGAWQANVAYAYRFGHGKVTDPDPACHFCSVAGKTDYTIHLNGIYVDASYKF